MPERQLTNEAIASIQNLTDQPLTNGEKICIGMAVQYTLDRVNDTFLIQLELLDKKITPAEAGAISDPPYGD